MKPILSVPSATRHFGLKRGRCPVHAAREVTRAPNRLECINHIFIASSSPDGRDVADAKMLAEHSVVEEPLVDVLPSRFVMPLDVSFRQRVPKGPKA